LNLGLGNCNPFAQAEDHAMLPRHFIERTLLLIGGALLAVHYSPARAQTAASTTQPAAVSSASALVGYRASAAQHIYATYAANIYKGTLPPLVHAVVVIDTEVDGRGNVRDVHVVRSPGHAPDVTQDVERMIRSASPFPAPSGAAPQRFTEVWLVDHSGRFQLHTLTEGQRDH
jgi:periplasmic protein TonB